MADKHGRKKIFIAGAVIDLFLYTGILLTSNVNVMIMLSFLEGLAASCTQAVGYIYMMEFLPEKQ